MNCLLLLIILFCCNGNSGCNTCNSSGRMAANGRNCATGRKGCSFAVGENNSRSADRDCDCDGPKVNACPTAPPPMPRTQFPYLDIEPRTCGCEENAGS